MGIEHIIADTDASELGIGYTPLITSGLEYLNFFGGSSAIGRNLAPGKDDGVVVGTPVAGTMAEGTTFRQTQNYLQTSVAHTGAMTLLAVGASVGEYETLLISNYTGGDIGMSLMMRTSAVDSQLLGSCIATYIASGGAKTLKEVVTPETIPVNTFQTLVAQVNNVDGGNIKLTNLSTGLSYTSSAYPAGSTPVISGNLRIGSGVAAVGPVSSTEILFVAIYSRVLSDDEVAALYAQIQTFYLASKAVVI